MSNYNNDVILDQNAEIQSLRNQLAAGQQREAELMAKVERLKQVPMKYRRMTFNAELQEENARLQAREAELVAHVERLREALDKAMRYDWADQDGAVPNEVAMQCIGALAAIPAQSLSAITDPLNAHIERLRDALENVEGALDESGLYQNYPVTYDLVIDALAAIPARSLARPSNLPQDLDDDIPF